MKGSKTAILQALRVYGAMPRAKIADVTGLSRATVSLSLAELLDKKLVQETAKNQNHTGRPSVDVELASGSHLVVGAELDSHGWKIVAVDLVGQVFSHRHVEVNLANPENCISVLIDQLSDFVDKLPGQPIPLLGLGLPGLVNMDRGMIESAADLGWFHVDIRKLVASRLPWPTAVINRHRAKGLSECRYGAGKEFNQIVYIGVSTGVAAGLYIDRRLVSGAIGGAGEIGHLTIIPDGPLCPCGNHGCLQLLSSEAALERDLRKLVRIDDSSFFTEKGVPLESIRARDILRAASSGDDISTQAIDRGATYMGIAMANIVNIINPDVIVLGGLIPEESSRYVDVASKIMNQRAMPQLSKSTAIRTATLSDIGGASGAAIYALDLYLTYSLIDEHLIGGISV